MDSAAFEARFDRPLPPPLGGAAYVAALQRELSSAPNGLMPRQAQQLLATGMLAPDAPHLALNALYAAQSGPGLSRADALNLSARLTGAELSAQGVKPSDGPASRTPPASGGPGRGI